MSRVSSKSLRRETNLDLQIIYLMDLSEKLGFDYQETRERGKRLKVNLRIKRVTNETLPIRIKEVLKTLIPTESFYHGSL